MSTSTCVKCGNHSFEMVEATPHGSNFKQNFIQCASCRGVVGLTDYYNIGQDLHDLEKGRGVKLGYGNCGPGAFEHGLRRRPSMPAAKCRTISNDRVMLAKLAKKPVSC